MTIRRPSLSNCCRRRRDVCRRERFIYVSTCTCKFGNLLSIVLESTFAPARRTVPCAAVPRASSSSSTTRRPCSRHRAPAHRHPTWTAVPSPRKRLPTGCSPNGIQTAARAKGRPPPPRKRSSASRCSGPREEPRTRRGLRCLARCALTPVETCRRRRSRAPPRASEEIRNLFRREAPSSGATAPASEEAIPSTRGWTRLDRLLGTAEPRRVCSSSPPE
mmetsp:Transcript_1419/g.6176  ORF Transcript_1419/g.6176 Transcript_1419/m.6176 type:complete len:219 (+) Transcript_1419:937-1593(+)